MDSHQDDAEPQTLYCEDGSVTVPTAWIEQLPTLKACLEFVEGSPAEEDGYPKDTLRVPLPLAAVRDVLSRMFPLREYEAFKAANYLGAMEVVDQLSIEHPELPKLVPGVWTFSQWLEEVKVKLQQYVDIPCDDKTHRCYLSGQNLLVVGKGLEMIHNNEDGVGFWIERREPRLSLKVKNLQAETVLELALSKERGTELVAEACPGPRELYDEPLRLFADISKQRLYLECEDGAALELDFNGDELGKVEYKFSFLTNAQAMAKMRSVLTEAGIYITPGTSVNARGLDLLVTVEGTKNVGGYTLTTTSYYYCEDGKRPELISQVYSKRSPNVAPVYRDGVSICIHPGPVCKDESRLYRHTPGQEPHLIYNLGPGQHKLMSRDIYFKIVPMGSTKTLNLYYFGHLLKLDTLSSAPKQPIPLGQITIETGVLTTSRYGGSLTLSTPGSIRIWPNDFKSWSR